MSVESSWRTIQLFISAQAAGVFEVEVDTDTKNTRCNCPVWRKSKTCKHTSFVKEKMRTNRGHYSILVPDEVSEEVALNAHDDPSKFRDFIVKYAKVEVL
jgi:hypothetical protein